MMLHQAIRKAKSGDVVEVLATDPSTSWDIPKFCMHLGHELLLKEEVLDEQNHKEYRYLVQKDRTTKNRIELLPTHIRSSIRN